MRCATLFEQQASSAYWAGVAVRCWLEIRRETHIAHARRTAHRRTGHRPGLVVTVRARPSTGSFVFRSALMWLVMTAILVVVPDALERWMRLEFARVIGWAVACGLWVVAIETEWKTRFGPFVRFLLQLILWVSAALLASWISDQFRVRPL